MDNPAVKTNNSKMIRFDTVEFREYPIILSDNPSPTSGPPIGIDWQCDPESIITLDVDQYELSKEEGSTRSKGELVMPPELRREMLLRVGYSTKEVVEAEKKREKAKRVVVDKNNARHGHGHPNHGSHINKPNPRNTRVAAKGSRVHQWHISMAFGSSHHRHEASSAKPKKCVRFDSAVRELAPIEIDWSTANEVWYSISELIEMGEARLHDAEYLIKQNGIYSSTPSKIGPEESADELELIDVYPMKANNRKTSTITLSDLLNHALSDPDLDPQVSIRGIEHFVYPSLKDEMIRRKKMVQSEVLEFVKSHKEGKTLDPQGWRLARHSRNLTQWARDVALEKGMRDRILPCDAISCDMDGDEVRDRINVDFPRGRGVGAGVECVRE